QRQVRGDGQIDATPHDDEHLAQCQHDENGGVVKQASHTARRGKAGKGECHREEQCERERGECHVTTRAVGDAPDRDAHASLAARNRLSLVACARVKWPRSLPRRMTSTRSDMPMISGRSEEIMRTAPPARANSLVTA